MAKNMNILATMAVLAAGCLVQIAAAASASPTVQVFPQAVVQGQRVCLADLASVSDVEVEQAQAMLAIEIADAPTGGNFAHIDVERIRKALADAEVNLATLCFTGSAECRVFRPGEPVNETGKATASAGPEGKPAAPQTLETAVREFVEKRLANLEGRVEIRFGAANRTALGLAGQDMSFTVRPRGHAIVGLLSLDVDVLEAGKISRTIPVLAEVSFYKHVVVARRPVNRGAAVRAEDISIEERRFTKVEEIGLTTAGLAINRQARRYIDRGEMVTAKDIQALPLVKRGEFVTVWFKRGGLTVRGSAKALKEGAQGDRIEVKAEPSGEVYAVTVTGPKTVEAESNASSLLSRAG